MGFCAENVGNWSSSPQNDLEFSPASPGAQLQEITVSTFSIQLGQIRLHSPIGSKKSSGTMEKQETALDRSWRKLRLILRRGRPISNVFGAKARANVQKGTFSTDCKSNCVTIGLSIPCSGRFLEMEPEIWHTQTYFMSPCQAVDVFFFLSPDIFYFFVLFS